ncbi:O-antigen ligase family protein [Conexibacter sp. SYSU D00693]|uniref:O-antigen ligase family protein n=1 Tax=Conexibacter sp. SYSU D00693 TaxID=2812560 RepID=UPI00196B4EC8|nr:O-antigen ligase family protein [Conexibacter sp. SYSU D00693]
MSRTQAPPAATAAPGAGRLRRAAAHPGLPATAVLAALVLACAYAAFADGAVSLREEARLQVGLAVLALLTTGAWVAGARLRPVAPRLAWWGVAALTALAAFSALSLLWSVAPDSTWQATNRALAYVLVVVLAIAAASSAPRALERVALGWLAVSLLVATYALGGKVAPGLDLLGLVDLDHTRDVARLRAPLGYWNALGLVCAMGAPVALRVAVDDRRALPVRLLGLAALFELLVVLGATYSRGAILGVLAAVAVLTLLGPARLKGLVVAVLAVLAALPPILIAYRREGLTTNGAPLDLRIAEGRVLLTGMVLCLGALLWVAWRLELLERRITWTAAHERFAWRAAAVTVALVAVVGSIVIASQTQGARGLVERIGDSFESRTSDTTFDPGRVVSTDSSNRVGWWKEALGSFSDKPAGGWGAGSFATVHLRYREDAIPVRQPHSVPLQFLSETGLPGFLLAFGGLGALAVVGTWRIRRLGPGTQRDLAGALLAVGAAWTVHGLVDWDWDIPGVTVPALLCVAALAATPGAGAWARRDAPEDAFRDVDREGRPSVGRAAGLTAATLLLAAYVASSVLPAWSESKTTAAQASLAEDASPRELEHAAAEADLAARLDPLAVRPLFAEATIAQRRGRLLDARRALLEAADRQPDEPIVWFRLASVALQLADRDGFRDASRRFAALDPRNPGARRIALEAEAFLTPAGASASATGTPLPLVTAQPQTTPGVVPGATTPGAGLPSQTTPPATTAPAPPPGATTPNPTLPAPDGAATP